MHDKSSKRKTTSTATARATRCQADPAAVLEMQVDNVNAELRAHTLVQLNGRLSCLHCGLGGVGGNWNGNIEKSSHCAIQRHLKDYHCLSVVGKHTNRSIATDSPSPSVSPIQALQGFGATEQERIEIEYIQKPFEPAAAAWGYELRFQTGLEPPFFPGEAHLDFVSFVAKNKIRQELLRGEHDGYKNFPSLLNTVNGYLRFRFQCEWRLVRVQTSPTLSTASQVTTGSGLGSPHSSYSASPPHSIAPSIGNHDFVGSAVPNVSQDFVPQGPNFTIAQAQPLELVPGGLSNASSPESALSTAVAGSDESFGAQLQSILANVGVSGCVAPDLANSSQVQPFGFSLAQTEQQGPSPSGSSTGSSAENAWCFEDFQRTGGGMTLPVEPLGHQPPFGGSSPNWFDARQSLTNFNYRAYSCRVPFIAPHGQEPAAAKPGVARGRGDDTTPPPTVDQPQVVEAAVQNRARLPPRNGDVVDTAAATGGQAQTAEEPLTPDDGSAVDGAAAQAEGGGGSGPPASPTRAGAAGALPSPPATPRREKLAADNASPGSLPEKGRPTTATEGGGKEAAAAATLRALVAGKLGAPIGSSSGQSVRDEDRGPKLPVFNNARPDLVIIMREGEHDPSDPLVKAVLSWIDKHPSRKLSESRAHAFVVEPSGKHVLVVGSGYHWQNGLEYESGSTRKRLNIEKDAAGDCSLCGQDHWELQCPKMPLHRLVVPEWRRQESTTERIYDAAPAPAPPSSPQQGTESDAARWREGTPPAVAAATTLRAVPFAPASPPATPRRAEASSSAERDAAAAPAPPPYSAHVVSEGRGPKLAVFGGARADRVIFWEDEWSTTMDPVVQQVQAWISRNPRAGSMLNKVRGHAFALTIRSTGERVLVLGSGWRESGRHGLSYVGRTGKISNIDRGSPYKCNLCNDEFHWNIQCEQFAMFEL